MPADGITLSGSTKKTQAFLAAMQGQNLYANLSRFAQMGVIALREATPKDTGLTAESWSYEIDMSGGNIKISWLNSNTNEGSNVAILLQYGHGTGTGGYVQGVDYINGALKSVFDQIADGVWKQVISS